MNDEIKAHNEAFTKMAEKLGVEARPPQPVRYLTWITREFVQSEPEARFCFGDNALRTGMGGQAKAMRGEPNAIGIATKWAPTMEESAFFSDKLSCFDVVRLDLLKVEREFRAGRIIYVPQDGLGTGLSQLPQRAPAVYKAIWTYFNSRSLNGCPWPKP